MRFDPWLYSFYYFLLLYYMIAIQNLNPQAGFCIAFDKASSLLGSLGPSRQ